MTPPNRTHETDAALVTRCLEHDPSAWREFVERFSRLIFSVVGATLRRYGGGRDEHVVDDLFGQVFIAFYDHDHRRLRRWSGRCSLASWVRLVTASVVVDALRRRRPEVSLDEEGGAGRAAAAALVDPAPLPIARAEELERAALVRRALDGLAPADRDLLVALYDDERPPGELAVALGVKPGALYTRKNRALARVRARVEALEEAMERGQLTDIGDVGAEARPPGAEAPRSGPHPERGGERAVREGARESAARDEDDHALRARVSGAGASSPL